MNDPRQATRVLKRDGLGRVELLAGDPPLVRRVASGGTIPGSGLVARVLLARERRALAALAELPAVPRLVPGERRGEGLRTYLSGEPLHRAPVLPRDYFEHLAALVRAVHARGVCHNDLHKEQNVLVLSDGRPGLIDFQLASVHPARRGRRFESRCRDDLRHVEKHRLRYERRGRPKRPEERAARALPRRSRVAGLWRRTAKPLYNFVTRRLLRTRDGEERRPSSGPWPAWGPPLGGDR